MPKNNRGYGNNCGMLCVLLCAGVLWLQLAAIKYTMLLPDSIVYVLVL